MKIMNIVSKYLGFRLVIGYWLFVYSHETTFIHAVGSITALQTANREIRIHKLQSYV